MKFKTYRLKVRRQRVVTDEMTVEIRAQNKVNATKRAKEDYAPDTGSSKVKTRLSILECKAI